MLSNRLKIGFVLIISTHCIAGTVSNLFSQIKNDAKEVRQTIAPKGISDEAKEVQRIIGRENPLPEKSLKNANCDGYGCYNVYENICGADPTKLRSVRVNPELYLPLILASVQTEVDCLNELPEKVRRLDNIPIYTGAEGLTKETIESIKVDIVGQTKIAEGCRNNSYNDIVRCLSSLEDVFMESRVLSYDDYSWLLTSQIDSNPLSKILPAWKSLLNKELLIINAKRNDVISKCRTYIEATLPVSEFMKENNCSEMFLKKSDVLQIENEYSEAWDAYNWSVANHEECVREASYNSCVGVIKYMEKFPEGQQKDSANKIIDNARWISSNPKQCESPKSKNDCDKVQKYIHDYPMGVKSDSAKLVLSIGMDKISRIIDDEAWATSNPGKCQKPMFSTDCDGVSSYIDRQINGKYISEATQLVQLSKKRIEELRLNEARQSENENYYAELCDLYNNRSYLGDYEKQQKRIDKESGTVNLSEKRKIATSKINLNDKINEIERLVKRNNGKFPGMKICEE